MRRRVWIVALCTILGVVLGIQIKLHSAATYEAQAVLYIQQPATILGTSNNIDPDRYVQSQVELLKNLSTAERVASQIDGETTDSVDRAIQVVQRPKTDIVDLLATAATPERAQLLANTYVDLYLADLHTNADSVKSPELEQIRQRLDAGQKRIGELGREINSVILPGQTVIPASVQPQVAERGYLSKEQEQLLGTQTQLELVSSLKVTTEIRQRAPLPTFPKTSSKRQVLAGVLGGPLLGIGIALLTARMSSKVMDVTQVEEMLGQPIAAKVGRNRGLAAARPDVIRMLPNAAEGAIDLLCVRAEANASPTSSLRIAVIGTQRGAGATTLAVAIAGRFARKGSTVVLVDADQNDPEVSDAFRATGDAGLPALLARADRISDVKFSGTDRRPRSATHAGNRPVYTPVTPDLRILGQGPKLTQPVLRRSNVPALLERLDNEAQVIVFDAGPLLDAATTVQIASAVDAIVLAVPVRRQRVSSLEAVARQLQTREGELLPVITSPDRRRQGGRRRDEAAPVVDAIEQSSSVDPGSGSGGSAVRTARARLASGSTNGSTSEVVTDAAILTTDD